MGEERGLYITRCQMRPYGKTVDEAGPMALDLRLQGPSGLGRAKYFLLLSEAETLSRKASGSE